MTSDTFNILNDPEPINVMEIRNPGNIMAVDEPEYYEIEVAYDTACAAHVCDKDDLPGYVVQESEGSRRGRAFQAAGGKDIMDEGIVTAEMISEDGLEITTDFNIAAVTRPLWAVCEIMDKLPADENGEPEAVFRKTEGFIKDKDGKTLTRFSRRGGLYIGKMRLKNPKHPGFGRQA